MFLSAAWETMRTVPAKQMHTQGSLEFIDWGKRFLVDAHKLQVPAWSSQLSVRAEKGALA